VAEHHHTSVIHVDGKEFKVEQATLSGAQIKALVGKDSTYQLFQELGGNHPDKPISDTDAIKIHSGEHFYTVPPATLGRSWTK
jgi:hypothetical protein